jgi:hypothetical protein
VPHEPIDLSKTLPEPSRATRIVQQALRLYCDAATNEFETIVDGMTIRVTRDGWMVSEGEKSHEG